MDKQSTINIVLFVLILFSAYVDQYMLTKQDRSTQRLLQHQGQKTEALLETQIRITDRLAADIADNRARTIESMGEIRRRTTELELAIDPHNRVKQLEKQWREYCLGEKIDACALIKPSE